VNSKLLKYLEYIKQHNHLIKDYFLDKNLKIEILDRSEEMATITLNLIKFEIRKIDKDLKVSLIWNKNQT